MVLGKLPVPGRPTNLGVSRARPTALAVGVGGDCLDIFSSPGRSPGRAIVLPPTSALAAAAVLAKC